MVQSWGLYISLREVPGDFCEKLQVKNINAIL